MVKTSHPSMLLMRLKSFIYAVLVPVLPAEDTASPGLEGEIKKIEVIPFDPFTSLMIF